MSKSETQNKYNVIMIGKPPKEDIYSQGLKQELEKLGLVVHLISVSGINRMVRELPNILRLLYRKKGIVHFQFYISMLSYRSVGYLFIPVVSVLYLLFTAFSGRIITTFHTLYSLSTFEVKLKKYCSVSLVNRILLTYWVLNIKILGWLSKKVVVLTAAAKSILEENYGMHNVFYIPMGCYKARPVKPDDLKRSREKMNVEQKQKIILLFGSPAWGKGYHHVIEAMPEVLRKIPEAKLIIAGGRPGSFDEYQHSLKELSRKLNVESSVMFYGHVLRDDIPLVISNSLIAVFPYEYEKERGVAASGALQEVIPYLKPAVVSDNPAFTMLEHNKTCLKVDATHKDELAEAIISLLSNERLYNNIARSLKSFVEENSNINEARNYIKLYEDALK